MQTEFWINGELQNMLEGLDDDPDNPSRLNRDTILYMLLHIPDAVASFDRLYPELLPAEQERVLPLRNIVDAKLLEDNVDAADRSGRALNANSVRRGGGWCPPPYDPPKWN